ncbi:MAG: hypothetical protein ABI633_06295, partial [Burkholderiales bacterium]
MQTPPPRPPPRPLPRPFGHAAEDLEIDFGSGDRPALVTALLSACAESADGSDWWQQPVGERTSALVALLRRSEGSDAMALTISCGVEGCGSRFEIELPHAAFAAAPQANQSIEVQTGDGAALVLRRPTGADLSAWRSLRPASREEAALAMLGSLCLSGEPHADDMARAAQALAEADPLITFAVVCACPDCGHEGEREVDLEGLALQRLAARQRVLLRE